ncbi:MAG: molybdopterin-binding protein, partial [Dehalococcoidia bacterium]|nr:molybdopterin-binding protein [Dehalococcoidia bacterium]
MVRIAVLTASDKGARGEREDASGALVVRRAEAEGHRVVAKVVVPDDRARIAEQLRAWCDDGVAELILTTGGTGLTERDVTPEATRDVAERDVPGIPLA